MKLIQKYFLFMLVPIVLILGVVHGSYSAEQASWTNYFGSHYRKEVWGDSVRDPVSPGKLAGPVDNHKVGIVKEYTRDKDIILGAGGLGSGRNQEAVDFFLTRMLLDYGKGWKSEVAAKALRLARESSSGGDVYWQFGNEINSHRFSETILKWSEGVGGNSRRRGNDSEIIPYYVEYYLAPGVEALRSAATERNGKTFKVILGSIASFANPKSQLFLNQLLNYRIEGLCATSLKGLRVADLVDVLALHYIASANVESWRSSLDELKSQWLGVGEIGAIWSTEELGIRRARVNAGAVFTTQVMARYTDWWLENDLDATQGRAFFWGADVGGIGHRGTEGMHYLYQFLGDSLLERINTGVDVAGSNLESYAFSVKNSGKKILFIFPRNQRHSALVQTLGVSGLKNGSKVLAAKVFTNHGKQSDNPHFRTQQGEVRLEGQFKLEPTSILIVTIAENIK